MKTYAIDFETYYDKETSITTMGAWHYLRAPSADIYMVSIKGPDVNYVGDPKKAPWDKIDGHRWVAHNYAFDGAVVERLHELGVTTAQPKDFFCTANLSAFMGAPRNLAGASKQLLGVDLSKDPRSGMKGKTWQEVKDTEQGKEFLEYAMKDAERCYDLHETFSGLGPHQGDREHAVEDGRRLHRRRSVGVRLGQVLQGSRHRSSALHLRGRSWLPALGGAVRGQVPVGRGHAGLA
jgi:hypothetical protein